MINPNQNIIKPLGMANNPNISINQKVKPSAIQMADSFMLNSLDLSKKGIGKYKGKKDKNPKVGIIDTPPYNKTPIQTELNKLSQNETRPKQKRTKNNIDASGFLMTGALIIGVILLLSQISKPIGSFFKKIGQHLTNS